MAATNASYTSHYVDVYGSKMHYIEQGAGTPILFLHGMPTSSYLWRNVIPYLAPLGRCIAPDFIGMGKSDKPNIEYTVRDHIQYIEKFIEVLNLRRLTIVMHDWGSVVGLDYAMRHESNCKGLVFYESYLRPMDGDDISLPLFEQMNSLQEQVSASDAVLTGAMFVDKVLPQGMMRPLTEEEMANYREPFLAAGSAKALQTYVNEVPRLNSKTEVGKIIADYSQRLIQSKVPKLMLFTVPGFVTTMATASWAKDNIPNLEIVDMGEELHYAQESNPSLMGKTISVWMQGVEQS
jgi:haloalkane dehalogenase